MNTTPPTTEQRLARLETNARRWKLAAVGLAGLVIGGLVVGFGPGDKYRGDFDLIDEEILDYLEAGGVFPVPKVVGVTDATMGNGAQTVLLRVWSDGTTEMMMPPESGGSYDGVDQLWWPEYVNGTYSARYAWRPFVDADLSP